MKRLIITLTALTLLATASVASAKLYLYPKMECQFLSCASGGFQLRTFKPSRIELDDGSIVRRVHWSYWGSKRAIGFGFTCLDECHVKVKLVVSDPTTDIKAWRECRREADFPIPLTHYYGRLTAVALPVYRSGITINGDNQATGPTIQC